MASSAEFVDAFAPRQSRHSLFYTPMEDAITLPPLSGVFAMGRFGSPDRKVADPLRSAIRQFKDDLDHRAGFLLGQLLADSLGACFQTWGVPAAIVPVPSEPGRLKERGFAPTVVLGACVSTAHMIPMLLNLLDRSPSFSRSINCPPSVTRTSFLPGVSGCPLVGRRLLLIDDVITTGTTLVRCGELLLSLGASEIYAAALAYSGYQREISQPRCRKELLLLSGPPGVGKTTLLAALLGTGEYAHPVHYTTRPPRPGERDGVDFNFVTADHFREMITGHKMFAWTSYASHYYGYSVSSVEETMKAEQATVLILEPQLALHVKERWPTAISIFLDPPDHAGLLVRLRERQPDMPSEWYEDRRVKLTEALNYRDFFDIHIVARTPGQTCSDFMTALAGRA